MILEVLVGSELVESFTDDDHLTYTLNRLKPLIGPDLHHLVNMMTIWEKEKPVREMMRRVQPMDHKKVRLAVIRVEEKRAMDPTLDGLLPQREASVHEGK